ncbi:hypothetical protein Hypma_000458 [Hypsizygus marmoreus]|uniref:Uncharacterized protein n=1 Tax=Hypsizygus marmoreus TaxID=39966 RepID=A0A369J838_HYPMA|nr:hypothetical protein Hypma_000458 [Hypsizygus marmoreus]
MPNIGNLSRYATKAHAHRVLGNFGKALDELGRALRRPDLEEEKLIVGLLTKAQMELGERLYPETKEKFDVWMDDVLSNDPESAERMKGVGKAWYTSC